MDDALTAAVKDKRKTQNLTRVTVTLRYQTLPADSDRNRYTHTLTRARSLAIKHKRTIIIRQLLNQSWQHNVNSLHVVFTIQYVRVVKA